MPITVNKEGEMGDKRKKKLTSSEVDGPGVRRSREAVAKSFDGRSRNLTTGNGGTIRCQRLVIGKKTWTDG